MHKVSVIIPIYKTEEYLKECIDSVINQTYKNIEIILINDGSPDNSEQICLEYCEKYSNIKYYHQKNQGVSIARNVGISKAEGEYVFFLDSDDYIDKNFIKSSVDIAIAKDSDIVIVSTNVFKRKSCDITMITRGGGGATGEVFVKKEILDNYPDIRFPEHYQHLEDSVFVNKLSCFCKQWDVNTEALYTYRKRENQYTTVIAKEPDKLFKVIFKSLKILERFYLKYNLFYNKRENFYYFIEFVIPFYWCFKFTKLQKKFFHKKIKYYRNLYNLSNINHQDKSLKSLMIKSFIKSPDYLYFEPLIYVIKIYNFFRKILGLI